MRHAWERLCSTRSAVVLTVMALILAFATFVVLAGGMSIAYRPQVQVIIFFLDSLMVMLISAVTVGQIGKMLDERRLGFAGARLHVRLITLFGVVAVLPTIVVGAVAALFFHYGVEIWFSNRVKTALNEARSVAAGYLQEHNDNIRTEAFALANTLISIQNDELFTHGTDLFHNPARLQELLGDEVYERGLTEAEVFDPLTNKVLAVGGLLGSADMNSHPPLPPKSVVEMARAGDVAILDRPDQRMIRAIISLSGNSGLMLIISRPVDPDIVEHMRRTDKLVQDYQYMIDNRGKTQVTVVVIFGLMGLLVLAVGMLTGLSLANRIANPLGLLILAVTRISQGDLGVRVPVPAVANNKDDEVTGLSRAFNQMTDQLESQRFELMRVYDDINERRRFTETVLSGVSAGVIGLDRQQIIELPNRAASSVLQRDLQPAIGLKLAERVPEFSDLLEKANQSPDRIHTQEVQVDIHGAEKPGGPGEGGGAGAGRTLLVRIVAEFREAEVQGYVVTFDDITDLQSAQRKAAWADVARRIAHEIKNPLTPIQLAAERLKRRFLKEITSDPEIYVQLVDTIVRQVGDIGRMVDEFSAFARMPQPIIQAEDFSRICREALILQRNAHPNILYETLNFPVSGPLVKCDRRLIGQALTNLLQNAADAILMVEQGKQDECFSGQELQPIGHIVMNMYLKEGQAVLEIDDDGVGLPTGERHRLTEPYVTHKAKGTGLGLAIVKKIMEDHGGILLLSDRESQSTNIRRGTRVTLSLPLNDTMIEGEHQDSVKEEEGRA
ncbi:sensor histidine kinase NtrY-like [Swingsia samuiensis]|uniref:histidine kinase n=1 Tax=Swingsia samuiensis TaxID=1293412 RepID=A0A4Y6UIG0_9PROT|nr:PAS domain-containing sensor histidine kinase [Swingsia samuiensis]QDH17322.1 PAS domain-containing sensor histidine kinase [Swingsia samuiensis]